MRPGRQHACIGETIQADDEHGTARGGGGGGDTPGQPSAAREDTQCRAEAGLKNGLAWHHGNHAATIDGP
jgi:hypothetical protein